MPIPQLLWDDRLQVLAIHFGGPVAKHNLGPSIPETDAAGAIRKDNGFPALGN
jgi:hypothetical protein